MSNNREFWGHSLDGLAVLGTTEVFKIIKLPIAVEELVVVADSFHIKPLPEYSHSP
ncbi:MAG: hypothetical protein U5J96_00010 [Ignavibacteriaceae bacterium]|nr:hypothetical protein [Ignavibacteriaceae bacterium]